MTVSGTEAAAAALTIAVEADLIRVRQALRVAARKAGLGLVDQTKLITAGSELARNILVYATNSRGTLCVWQVAERGHRGVRASFSDDGPGIDDVDKALTDGFSTAGSLGLGLPGAKRLTDRMTITTGTGQGTTVEITKWAR